MFKCHNVLQSAFVSQHRGRDPVIGTQYYFYSTQGTRNLAIVLTLLAFRVLFIFALSATLPHSLTETRSGEAPPL